MGGPKNSVFPYCGFSPIARNVEKPKENQCFGRSRGALGRVLGPFGGLLGPLEGVLRPLEGLLRPLGGILEPPGAVFGASWAVLGASWAVLRRLGGVLGRLGALWARSWALAFSSLPPAKILPGPKSLPTPSLNLPQRGEVKTSPKRGEVNLELET